MLTVICNQTVREVLFYVPWKQSVHRDVKCYLTTAEVTENGKEEVEELRSLKYVIESKRLNRVSKLMCQWVTVTVHLSSQRQVRTNKQVTQSSHRLSQSVISLMTLSVSL